MQLNLVDRELVDSLLDDPDFDSAFIQDGYAVLLFARLACVPREIGHIELGLEFRETKATLAEQGLECANGETCQTGNSWHSQSAEAVVIEAVTVDGPFRDSLFDRESLNRLRMDLSELLEHIQQELEVVEANAIFDANEIEQISDRLPSAETLLEELCDDLKRRMDDPNIARFLKMAAPTDGQKGH